MRETGRVRVVVVDDHPLMRKGLVDLLNEQADLTVCGDAATSAAALELATAHKPHVAIVDLSLGTESGLALVAALSQLASPVRVLVLSGYDERLHADRALKAGASGYIMKDQPTAELLKAVRRVAGGKSYVSDDVRERILSTLGPSRQTTDHASSIDRLSDRERQVLALVGRGHSTREIAQQLQLSVKTVEAHYAHMKTKLGLRNGRELMRVAVSWSERNAS